MLNGRANVRYGMISPRQVLNSPMSDHSLNSGAAIAICGNVEMDRTIARITYLKRSFSRASAYAQKDPTASASTVVDIATTALLRSAFVKSGFWKILL